MRLLLLLFLFGCAAPLGHYAQIKKSPVLATRIDVPEEPGPLTGENELCGSAWFFYRTESWSYERLLADTCPQSDWITQANFRIKTVPALPFYKKECVLSEVKCGRKTPW